MARRAVSEPHEELEVAAATGRVPTAPESRDGGSSAERTGAMTLAGMAGVSTYAAGVFIAARSDVLMLLGFLRNRRGKAPVAGATG